MPSVDVDEIRFSFPDDWQFSKFNEWSYYRKYSQTISGIKAVDLLVIDPARTAWLVGLSGASPDQADRSVA